MSVPMAAGIQQEAVEMGIEMEADVELAVEIETGVEVGVDTGLESAVGGESETDISMEASDLIAEACMRIGNKLGSVSMDTCVNTQLSDSGARSVLGQVLLLKEYPPLLEKRKPLGRVLLIGGTHGDEYASVSVVFKWMQTLNQYHSGLFHWHVAPLVNPDGLLLSKPSVRLNAHGVDLNRNMPTPNWYKETAIYWQQMGKDPRRYPGTEPLSEPESRWLYEEIRNFQPDVIISVHAPYGLLDYDGPSDPPEKIGHLRLDKIGAYPGSLGNSAGNQHAIPVLTLELPAAGSMPSTEQVSDMWMDLVRWLRHNIPQAVTQEAYTTFDATTESLLASPPLTAEEAADIAAMPVTIGGPASVVNINEALNLDE